jgi:hypothetical protein
MLHGVISQKIVYFILTAMRTSLLKTDFDLEYVKLRYTVLIALAAIGVG